MRVFQFLRECYNTEMYSESETLKHAGGKYLGLIFDFFVVLPFYLGYLAVGYLMVRGIVKMFFSNNELFGSQWLWMLSGVLFGLFLSVIFQAIPKHGETPKRILGMLFHHLVFLGAFMLALLVWIIIIAVISSVFGFI